MAALRSLVFLLVAACWFLSLINAAAIHNLISDDKLSNAVDDEDLELENHIVLPYRFRSRRSSETETPISCGTVMQCGWDVYDPVTRVVQYFFKNTCNCPESLKCVKTGEEKLSIGAYIYRCRAVVV